VGATSPSGWPTLHCTAGAVAGVGLATALLDVGATVWLLAIVAADDLLPAGAVEAGPLLTSPVAEDADAGVAVAACPAADGPKEQPLSSVTNRSSDRNSEERCRG